MNIGDVVSHFSCGRVPWKTERDGTGVNKRENCRVIFLPDFCLFVSDSPSKCSVVSGLSLSLSLSLSLFLSLSLSLSPSLSLSLSRCLSLSLIIIYMHICAWQSADSRVTTDHCRVTLRWVFTKSFLIAWNVQKRCLTVSRRSRDLRPLSRDRSATFFKIFPNRLKRLKNVVWQSADGRVTSDHCLVTVQRLFSKKISNCLKRRKIVVWQSADSRVTSDHCQVTVQRLFSKFSQIAWNVRKTLFDSRPTVAWPPTTVAWPFSDFFQKNFKMLKTSKNRCLTVGRQLRDLRSLSRDRSATLSKKFSICFKRRRNVVWQSADGRVTFDHCCVTVQRLTFKILPNCLKRPKTLFDSRPTVAWPQLLPRDRSATFFKIFPNRLKRPKNVVWQSADGLVTFDHCRVTVQPLLKKIF